jgi:PelA/Pel-15E family pectate lyase
MKPAFTTALGLLIAVAVIEGSVFATRTPQVAWSKILDQPDAFYGAREAEHIADNVLAYQRSSGGWPKNIDMSARISADERDAILKDRNLDDSTIDNDATHSQIAFLARVHHATRKHRFSDAALRGIDYLLKAQYENGGWPQYYPRLKGYYRRITFNDGAMTGVLELLREIAHERPVYDFVDRERRERAASAVERGIDCILRCQVIVEGKPTAWCAQHDEETLAPAEARSYEKISLSGSESVDIVRFLMGIENPDERVIDAIEAAIGWFESVRIKGLRVVRNPDSALPRGYDVIAVEDQGAPPLWARFYEIGSNRPFFCGRDGIIKWSLAEIEHERRIGYNWYTTAPEQLLVKDYPAWSERTRTARK